jgi:hypothetical protein
MKHAGRLREFFRSVADREHERYSVEWMAANISLQTQHAAEHGISEVYRAESQLEPFEQWLCDLAADFPGGLAFEQCLELLLDDERFVEACGTLKEEWDHDLLREVRLELIEGPDSSG